MKNIDKIYRLYVMTHKITGLKYLGFTTQDLSYYKGSGSYWRKHLKVHGNFIDVEVIHESTNKEEISKLGLHYSNIWNIVKAVDESGRKLWANEKPESGVGGGSPEITAKIRETKIKNGTFWSTPEIKNKIRSTKEKNNTINCWTPESTLKMRKTRLEKYGTTNFNTPESIAKSNETKLKNGTAASDQAVKDKIKETKIRNKSNANTPESILLRRQTKHKNFIKRYKEKIPKVLDLYNNGIGKYQIHKQVGLSYDVVSTIIKKQEIYGDLT